MSGAVKIVNLKMSSAKKEEFRSRFLNNLWFFNWEIMRYRDINSPFHREEMEKFDRQRRENVLDFIKLFPRGHLKTCCFTIAGTLQDLARNPDERILIMNATSENAVDIVRVIAQHIMANEVYNFYFPEIRPPDIGVVQWKRDKIVINRKTIAKEGSVEAVGIDTNIVGKHFNRIKFDDIVNDENTQSFERLERTFTQFQLVTPVLEPGGTREIYGTRWAYRDVYGRLIEDGKFQVSMRQLREKNVDTEEEEYIFPQKYNPKEEARIRSTMSDFLFNCQYFNAPISQKEKLFPTEYFKYYEALPPHGVFVTTVDPASTTEKYSNKSAIVTCYWTPMRADGMPGDIYVFKYTNQRLRPEALLESMILELTTVKPSVFSVEIVQDEGFWTLFLQTCQRRGIDTSGLRKFKPPKMQHKYERIALLEPDFKAGRLLMKKEHYELQKQMEEYTGWRRNEEDDICDALAQQKTVGFFPVASEETCDDALDEAEEDVICDSTGW